MSVKINVEGNSYPRPQYVRNDWKNLNGTWEFTFDDEDRGEKEKWFESGEFDKKILVPFTYESKASGISDETVHSNVWYRRKIKIDEEYKEKQVRLHFQASDYITKVWVNGIFVGKHVGGNAAFSLDISETVSFEEENTLVVKVEDSLSTHQPRGKQRWKHESFRCWYVQTTGIWQTVWLEYLEDQFIERVKVTPELDTASVDLEYHFSEDPTEDWKVETAISFEGQTVKEVTFVPAERNHVESIQMDKEELNIWSMDTPHLYDISYRLVYKGETVDEVSSYFGMRKIEINNGQVELNNEPVYQKLLLDQGYWDDTMLTPPSEEALIEDIDKTLAMGFNGVRKHQKLEDERFLYWADKKGLLVWSEMAAAYAFSDEAIDNFTREWLDIVQQHYNHPSIITWVPFNESWGVPNIMDDVQQQTFTQSIYYLTKSFDKHRPVIVNDGWEHTISDIIALHDYEEDGETFKNRYKDKDYILGNNIKHNHEKFPFADGFKYQGQPVMLTEYGGIAFKDESGWGYGNQVETEEDFLARLQDITDAIKATPYISGYCYTQTTDVQQEINGLLTMDRTPKVAMEKIKEINDR